MNEINFVKMVLIILGNVILLSLPFGAGRCLGLLQGWKKPENWVIAIIFIAISFEVVVSTCIKFDISFYLIFIQIVAMIAIFFFGFFTNPHKKTAVKNR